MFLPFTVSEKIVLKPKSSEDYAKRGKVHNSESRRSFQINLTKTTSAI